MRWLTSLLLSLLFSLSISARVFSIFGKPWPAQLFLWLVSAFAIGILLYLLFPFWAGYLKSSAHKRLLVAQSSLAALFFALFESASWPLRLVDAISVGMFLLLCALPFASGYDHLAAGNRLPRFLFASLAGGLAAFFPAALLIKFYPAYLLPIPALLLSILFGIGFFLAWNRLRALFRVRSAGSLATVLTFLLTLGFVGSLAGMVLGYPGLFARERFLPSLGQTGALLALLSFSPVVSAWLLSLLEQHGHMTRLRQTLLWEFVRENLPGLLLGSLFFAAYSLLSHTLNHPGLDLTENFLAADTYAWTERLASPTGTQVEMRAVHPYAFFIFRPVVWFGSLLFNGDRYAATLLLIPLTGGVCVFLAYLFIKRWSGSEPYSLSVAALLGVSTSHLLFASLIESYIFSAAALLLFFLLLLDERTHWLSLAAVGILTFGITITNFIQTFIGFVVARPRLRSIFMYGLVVSVLAILLTLLHAATFPSALMFFDPAAAGMESEYSYSLAGEPAWRVTGRVVMLARNIALYSLVAPDPFILTTEVGGNFPRFNFFKLSPGQFSHSSYGNLGTLLVLAWAVLLWIALAAFLRDWIRSRRLPLTAALALAVLFNFLLHLGYGYEPFLYSANWTYAVVLFVGASLSGLGRRAWLQLGLVVFLGLLMANQWLFVNTILRAIHPFFN